MPMQFSKKIGTSSKAQWRNSYQLDVVKRRAQVKQKEEHGQRPGGEWGHRAYEELQEGHCLGVRGTCLYTAGSEAAAAGPSGDRILRSLLCQINVFAFDEGKRQATEGFKQCDDVIPLMLFRRISAIFLRRYRLYEQS